MAHPLNLRDLNHREYIARRLVNPQGALTIWGESIMQAYARVAKFSFMPAVGLTRRSDLLILGTRIFNKLSDETRSRTHLIMTARDLWRAKTWPRSLTYDPKSYSDLYSLLVRNDEKAYVACQRRAEKIIQKTGAQTIVANSTIDPINRLWLETASYLGLRTMCVQHGVYGNALPDYVLEEDIIDRYVALDEGQAAILRKNIRVDKLVTLGVRDHLNWVPPMGVPKLCFVGEDWERYGLEKIKRLIIGKYVEIAIFLRSHGYTDLYYKPHPSEEMMLDIGSHTKFLKPSAVNLPDVYIGFASTMLKEMASCGKLAIQVWDAETGAQNFEKLGYCLSIPNEARLMDRLLSILRGAKSMPCIRDRRLEEVLI